jgi:hypothetical protein
MDETGKNRSLDVTQESLDLFGHQEWRSTGPIGTSMYSIVCLELLLLAVVAYSGKFHEDMQPMGSSLFSYFSYRLGCNIFLACTPDAEFVIAIILAFLIGADFAFYFLDLDLDGLIGMLLRCVVMSVVALLVRNSYDSSYLVAKEEWRIIRFTRLRFVEVIYAVELALVWFYHPSNFYFLALRPGVWLLYWALLCIFVHDGRWYLNLEDDLRKKMHPMVVELSRSATASIIVSSLLLPFMLLLGNKTPAQYYFVVKLLLPPLALLAALLRLEYFGGESKQLERGGFLVLYLLTVLVLSASLLIFLHALFSLWSWEAFLSYFVDSWVALLAKVGLRQE